VTRCPTACIVSTHGKVPEADRAALRNHAAPKESARQEKLNRHQQMIAFN
jgi:hypothetical protein